ncbi:MAG: diacylglycerol kinase family protein [Candidatus Uhrbacteria bacterium]
MWNLKALIKSLSHALRGVILLLKTEQSFRLQLMVSGLVIFFCLFLPVTAFEVIVIFLLIALVLVLEMINSIFERLVDTFKPRIHPVVGEIKDIMAAAVFVAAFFAALIGLIIFLPHFWRLFSY